MGSIQPNELMHQSIPAVPIPLPGISGAFFLIVRAGH